MNKNNKAQVIIITLWILIILSLLAVSVANRVSLGLRLSRFATDRLKARALAVSGINRTIIQLDADNNSYDSLKEFWADSRESFKEVRLVDSVDNEVYSIEYTRPDESLKPSTIFGVIDEERKLNINLADEDLLRMLFEELKVSDAGKISRNIMAWRGDSNIPPDDESRDYSLQGYPCKAAPLVNIEELLLVKGMTPAIFEDIKDFITVWGIQQDRVNVNINTASRELISVLIKYAVFQNGSGSKEAIAGLLDAIIEKRKADPFLSIADLSAKLNLPEDSEENNIFNSLQQFIDVQSDFFYISAVGIIKNRSHRLRLECVYDRSEKAIKFWHQD